MDAGWQNDFLAFQQWALDNGYAKGKHLIRHNIDGDFTPENCAFVEQETSQMMNKDARILTFFNETKTRAAWLRDARCRVSGGVLDFRLKAGWSPESALSTPPKPSGYRHPEGYTLTTIPVGAQFGKLTVRSAHQRVKYPSGNSEYFYACDCACGTTHHLANANRLLKGTLTSCGCQRGKRYAQPVSGLDRHE